MNEETRHMQRETPLDTQEQKSIFGSIIKIGKFLLDKVQTFVESQEGEISEANRHALQDNQTDAKISRISK